VRANGEVSVNAYRGTAIAVGVLFIVASVAAIVGGSLILPIEDGLPSAAASEAAVSAGVLLEFVLVLSVVGIAVLLYPVLRPHGEGLALGYVAARILEAVLLLAAAMSARVVLALAVVDGTANAEAQAGLALAIREWTYLTGSLLLFGVSAVILYSLLYRGRLVPAWLSLWGLVGGVLIAVLGAVEVGGVAVPGEVHGLLVAPIGLNEMVLAIWLIVRGFDPRGVRTVVESLAPAGRSSPTAAAGR
jgi:hypothetical protein